MEWSKIKNIVIIILLCVNIALLGLVAVRENRQAQFAAETWAGAVITLERSGISFQAEQPPLEIGLIPLNFTRDREGELAAAERLLGPLEEAADSSPVRTLYTGPGGTAEFSISGEFTLQLASGVRRQGTADIGEAGAACLEELGFTGRLWEERPEGSSRYVCTYVQMWAENPVFSCKAELVWEGDSLVSVQGRRLAGSTVPAGGEELLSTAGALVRFLAGLNQTGDMCSRIDTMSAGYLMTGSRPVQLIPVWFIETDNGGYYLNAVSGEVSLAG